MAEMQICEKVATQASHNLEIHNAVYGPWSNMHCVQRCVTELQGEGNGAAKLSVFGFMLLCECQWINLQHSWLKVR
jgi:hypothetical protein